MDGNRRWARAAGLSSKEGHSAGAEHLKQLLTWCSRWGIEHVSVYVLSADNIRKRSGQEVENLFELLTNTLPKVVTDNNEWSLHVAGDMNLLPKAACEALNQAVDQTKDRTGHLTMAVGYDGRGAIVEAIRTTMLNGDSINVDTITQACTGGPVKNIDLVIRTGSQTRLSGFFPWQTTHAELYLSSKMWPAFTVGDFEDALHYYGSKLSRH